MSLCAMPLAITSPWRRLGRVGLCLADATGRYLLTWVAAWLVYALTAPRQHELESYLPRTRSYWRTPPITCGTTPSPGWG